MSKAEPSTGVLLIDHPGWARHRLRFGRPRQIITLTPLRKLAVFGPGELFGYIRWQANYYGTQDWRVYVVRAAESGSITRMPGILPGGEVLFSVRGKTRAKRALDIIDELEAQAGDLRRLTPAFWRQVQIRFDRFETPHNFDPMQAKLAHMPL